MTGTDFVYDDCIFMYCLVTFVFDVSDHLFVEIVLVYNILHFITTCMSTYNLKILMPYRYKKKWQVHQINKQTLCSKCFDTDIIY